MEQIDIPWTNVAVLSMSGQVNVGNEEGEAQLLGNFEDLLNGKYQVLLGHPESFTTAEGQRILNELSRLNLISMVVVDEVQKYFLYLPSPFLTFKSLAQNILDKRPSFYCLIHFYKRLDLKMEVDVDLRNISSDE